MTSPSPTTAHLAALDAHLADAAADDISVRRAVALNPATPKGE